MFQFVRNFLTDEIHFRTVLRSIAGGAGAAMVAVPELAGMVDPRVAAGLMALGFIIPSKTGPAEKPQE